ncbi:MAG: exo-beta-N-acetylmuramidase NamZ domain-containing protein [Terriglobales bacterium]
MRRSTGIAALATMFVAPVGAHAGARVPHDAAARDQTQAGPGHAQNEQFAAVDAIFQKAVEERQIPGAVVVVGHDGKIVYEKAFGWRSLEPRRETMTLDTVFDMASLTKSMATAMSVMRLVQYGQVRLNDPVSRYIPEFGSKGKEQITVRQLLTHFSGLEEDLDLKQPWRGKETAFRMAMDEAPVIPPGSRFLYSDVDYVVLGFLVERVSGLPLEQYAAVHIYEPLGMMQSRFLPPAAWQAKIAPSEYDERGQMLRGVVHDPTARRMGGVAGHAGLFSTAADTTKFAQAMLDGGGGVLAPEMIEKMTTPQQPPTATSLRGLGWDIDSPFASNRGDLLPVGSYGHTGFTGTSLWIDPTTRTYIIILSNAVHPRGGNGAMISLRNRVATAVTAGLKLTAGEEEKMRLARITGYNDSFPASRRVSVRNGQAKTGIDVLEEHGFRELKTPSLPKTGADRGTQNTPGLPKTGADRGTQNTRRIGLVTNQTGMDGQGRRTIDVLAHAEGVKLAAIFSPEHGATGELDTTAVGDTVDRATGVPVYSVYGATDAKRRPPLEVMKNLDAVVFDLQDAGARFYTYETTLGYFLEAAAQTGVEMVVLDRPNPITGAYVQGPVSEPGTENYNNYMPEALRHGMTLGELAKMFNSERHINAKLTVVAMEGWLRGDWFDSTGLPWVNPSPNLRNLTQAALYPGVAMIEGTNVSVGRGTDTPFEVMGAPWIKAKELSDYLNARNIQGVRFVPIQFTPATGAPYAGQKLGGVNIVLLRRDFFDAPELGIELASALRKLYASEWDMSKMILLVNSKQVMEEIAAGVDPRRIAEEWREELERFGQVRAKYLIY